MHAAGRRVHAAGRRVLCPRPVCAPWAAAAPARAPAGGEEDAAAALAPSAAAAPPVRSRAASLGATAVATMGAHGVAAAFAALPAWRRALRKLPLPRRPPRRERDDANTGHVATAQWRLVQ